MMKYVVAVALAAVLVVPEAASHSVLQKSGHPKPFESYLPASSIVVPWLDLDSRTKLPKRDWSIGWQANAMLPFVLPPTLPNPQVSSTATLEVRRM